MPGPDTPDELMNLRARLVAESGYWFALKLARTPAN
jgi:hypothetical protein